MTSTVLDDPALVAPEASAFAAAVRAALDDLDAEERDDLTDGLEAELMDRVADSGADSLGDPVAYAEELRTAAGLPSRARRRVGLGASLARAVAFVREDSAGWLERHPRWAGLLGFLGTLRPVWWALRAVIAFQILALLLGGGDRFLLPVDGVKLLLLAGLVVLSVQLGRGRWLPQRWMRGTAGVVHVILIVAAPFVAGHAITVANNGYWAQQYMNESQTWGDTSVGEFATTTDGTQIENVFVYDAVGTPVPGAQLFDQDGRPLNLVGFSGQEYVYTVDGSGAMLVPSDATPGRAGWNVYPLATVGADAFGVDGIDPRASRTDPPFPFAVATPLVDAAPIEDAAEASGTD